MATWIPLLVDLPKDVEEAAVDLDVDVGVVAQVAEV
jgi:hypothetical protein